MSGGWRGKAEYLQPSSRIEFSSAQAAELFWSLESKQKASIPLLTCTRAWRTFVVVYCVLVGVACVCRCTVYFDIFIPVVFHSHPKLSLCPTPDIYIIFAHVDKCMHSMMEDKLRRIKRNESKTLSGRGIFMIAFTNDKDYCHYHCIYGNSYASLIFWSRYHCVDCCLQFLFNGVRCKMPTTPRIAKSTFHFNL